MNMLFHCTYLWIFQISLLLLIYFIPLWFATFLDAFILFLDYIGMFLGPEIAVFLVDFFFIRKGQYELSEFTKVDGKYWYNGGLNWLAIGAWLIGIALYFGLKSVDIISQTIGVTFVAMALTGVIYYIAAKLLKK